MKTIVIFVVFSFFTLSCDSNLFCDSPDGNVEECITYAPSRSFKRKILRIDGIKPNGASYKTVLSDENIIKLAIDKSDTIFFNLNEDFTYEFFVQTFLTWGVGDDPLYHHEKGTFEVSSEGPFQECRDYYWNTHNWKFISDQGRVVEHTYNGPCHRLFSEFNTITADGDSLRFSLSFNE